MYLGATSLDETTCEEVKRKKAEAAKNSERFEKKLQESEELNEESVAFPGDAAGFRVNFLKNVPFLQVVAGGDVFERKAGLSVMDRLKQRAGMVEMHEHGAQHTTRAYTKHLETEKREGRGAAVERPARNWICHESAPPSGPISVFRSSASVSGTP